MNLNLFIFLSSLILCAITQAVEVPKVYSLEHFASSDAVTLARQLYADGKGKPADFKRAYEAFKTAAANGDPVAQYYAGHMHLYACGTELDFAKAWHYFELSAAQGIDRAYGRMAHMLHRGLGRAKDFDRGIEYNRIAAQSDAQAMSNLAYYIKSGAIEGREEDAIDLLEQAVAADNQLALNNLGYYHSFGKIKKPNAAYGVKLLKRAAAKGDINAAHNLLRLKSGGSPLVPKSSELLKGEIKEPSEVIKMKARKWIIEAVESYRADGIEAGLSRLEDKLSVWLQTEKFYPFRRQVWWEAQVLSGREDPEWSFRLYTWLYEKAKSDYLARNPGKHYLDSAMLHNLSKEQLATGRIAALAETAETIRQGLLKKKQIDLSLHPRTSLRLGRAQLPRTEEIQTYVRRLPAPQHSAADLGKPLFYGDIFGLIVLPRSKLYQGSWRETLCYDEWIYDWIEAVIQDGAASDVSRPNEVWQLQADASLQDAQVYERLGFYQKALENYAQVIDANHIGYRFRHVHDARTKHSLLATSIDLKSDENSDTLEELRALRADNKFDTKRAPHEVDLALASLLRQQGNLEAARDKLNNVIISLTSERLFPARIDALRQRVIWALEDGISAGVEEDLIALLNLCRDKGLKINEPELYHFYAQLKANEGNLSEAIKLQHTAIEFYQSIDLYTWLPLRYIELATWYHQIGNYDLAEYYMQLARSLINQADADYPAWLIEQTNHSCDELETLLRNSQTSPAADESPIDGGRPHTIVATEIAKAAAAHIQVDLQPIQIVSIPIKGKPALALYTVSNLATETLTVNLSAEGHVARFQKEAQGDFQIKLERSADYQKINLEVDLQPNQAYLIYVQAAPEQQPLELTIAVLQNETQVREAHFEFPESDKTSKSAIINAAYIQGNPYYMTSVFHLLQRAENTTHQTMDLRMRTSAPARLEGYNGDGELIFVDSDGDGAFHSAGDVLRNDSNNDGFPDVAFAPGEDQLSLELLLVPEARPESGMLEVMIETKDDTDWRMDTTDTIRY